MEMMPKHWFKTCFPFGCHGCCHVHPDVQKLQVGTVLSSLFTLASPRSATKRCPLANNEELNRTEIIPPT